MYARKNGRTDRNRPLSTYMYISDSIHTIRVYIRYYVVAAKFPRASHASSVLVSMFLARIINVAILIRSQFLLLSDASRVLKPDMVAAPPAPFCCQPPAPFYCQRAPCARKTRRCRRRPSACEIKSMPAEPPAAATSGHGETLDVSLYV